MPQRSPHRTILICICPVITPKLRIAGEISYVVAS